jgi:hypothetical protein
MRFKPEIKRMNDDELHFHDEPINEPSYKYGTSLWFEKINSKLYDISQETFTWSKKWLEILSLQIPSFQRIKARNCVLGFFEDCQSIQHG